MKYIRLLITSLLFIGTSAFAFEPSTSKGMEAHIYLESNHAGGVSKVWGRACETCEGKPFSVLDTTEFKKLEEIITPENAFLNSGNFGVIIYNINTLEATQVIFFQ
ncbi:hypothetical protein A9Q81_03105 [Gammaproteobacteria bacterium 42_54_T18]|nr:hypothetical protein A9Q81_03105 [Gammaproteobacteria bacterium 42_54_T18]